MIFVGLMGLFTFFYGFLVESLAKIVLINTGLAVVIVFL